MFKITIVSTKITFYEYNLVEIDTFYSATSVRLHFVILFQYSTMIEFKSLIGRYSSDNNTLK